MNWPAAETFEGVAGDVFGVKARAVPLSGERDWNVRLDVDGMPRYLLKVHATDADDVSLDLQDAVLSHLSDTAPAVRTPGLVDGAAVRFGGRACRTRLLDWIHGRVWAEAGPPDPARFRALGRAVAQLDSALTLFDHASLDRRYRWNMLHAGMLVPTVSLVNPSVRPFTERVLDRFPEQVLPSLQALPHQAIHNDANEHNVLLDREGGIAGIIDVGDVVRAPRVCGLAVALVYAQLTEVDPTTATLPVVQGYDEQWPLTEEELALLPDLVDTRLAMSVANAADQRRADPDNAYLDISQPRIERLIDVLSDESRELRQARYREACGYRPVAREPQIVSWLQSRRCDPVPVLRVEPSTAALWVLDWSPDGPADLRMSHDPEAVGAAIEQRMDADGTDLAIGRYGEKRDVYRSEAFAPVHAGGEWRDVHLGIDIFATSGETVFAPLDGVIHSVEHRDDPYDFGGVVLLEHRTDEDVPFWILLGHLSAATVAGNTPGQEVRRGARIGAVGAPADNGGWPAHIHVQLFTTLLGRSTDLPGVVRQSELGLWKSICPDPSIVLRLPLSSITGSSP